MHRHSYMAYKCDERFPYHNFMCVQTSMHTCMHRDRYMIYRSDKLLLYYNIPYVYIQTRYVPYKREGLITHSNISHTCMYTHACHTTIQHQGYQSALIPYVQIHTRARNQMHITRTLKSKVVGMLLTPYSVATFWFSSVLI